MPIGTSTNRFKGIFDGNGHTVSGIYINNATSRQGLFGYIDAATVKNIGVINSYIKGGEYVGGIAGVANNASKITKCYNKGTISSSNYYVGGIVGYMKGDITNCYNAGEVSGDDVVFGGNGGIAGNITNGTITNCYNTGAVGGATSCGGLAGYNVTGKISISYNSGLVNGTVNNIGGVVGYNEGGIIESCYNTNTVSGVYEIGGIAGNNQNNGTITNCYNEGNVTGTNNGIGGLAGNNALGTISNGYNTGSISGLTAVGGMIGVNSATVANCYNIGTVSGNIEIGGLVGNGFPGSITRTSYWLDTSVSSGLGIGFGALEADCFVKTSSEMKMSGFLSLLNTWVTNNSANTPAPIQWEMIGGKNSNYPALSIVLAPFDPIIPPVIPPVTTTVTATEYIAPSTFYETMAPQPQLGDIFGWTKIDERILLANTGDKLAVKMNGTTNVPQSILSDLKGRDITVNLDFGTYSWEINGEDITVAQSVDLGITYTPNVIRLDLVKGVAESNPYIQLQLNYTGSLGFTGKLTVHLPAEMAGQYGNLYYYNPKTQKLELYASALIEKGGTATFNFNHASEYVVVMEKTPKSKDISAGESFQDDADLITDSLIKHLRWLKK